jgi:hypothetical protein
MTPHTHPLPDGRSAYCSDRACPAMNRAPHQHRAFVGYSTISAGRWADVPCEDESCFGDDADLFGVAAR